MEMTENRTTTEKPVQRLCSEIQLFDLCDRETCRHRNGRFCSQEELLTRFEQIADVDESTQVYGLSDDAEDDEESDGMGFDAFEGDGDEDGRDGDE